MSRLKLRSPMQSQRKPLSKRKTRKLTPKRPLPTRKRRRRQRQRRPRKMKRNPTLKSLPRSSASRLRLRLSRSVSRLPLQTSAVRDPIFPPLQRPQLRVAIRTSNNRQLSTSERVLYLLCFGAGQELIVA